MSFFHDHIAAYLNARRALGFKLAYPGRVLPQFASYLQAAGARTLTAELAVAWAGLPEGIAPICYSHRLGAVRGFARYLKTIEPATEVPPVGIWPTGHPRPAPYIWAEKDIARLVDAAHALQPRLKGLTFGTLFGLLASSGLRVGEALCLTGSDVDLTSGLLTVRDAKFGRERYVPLHPSKTEALRSLLPSPGISSPAPSYGCQRSDQHHQPTRQVWAAARPLMRTAVHPSWGPLL